MAFLGVYRAVYDYAPQSDGELTLSEGDLLFVLEKSSEDDWWKAKKKAVSDDDDEPEGLIPNNYIEEAPPLYQAKALYDYTKQTDEELSFPEEARLDVYDTSDEDWTLVGLNGQYGFAPAIYIEKASAASAPAAVPAAPAMPVRPQTIPEPEPEPEEADWNDSPPESPVQNPAAALAGIIAQKTGQSQHQTQPQTISYQAPVDRGLASPPLPARPQYTPEESDDEHIPSMPPRPTSNVSREPVRSPAYSPEPAGVTTSLPYNRAMAVEDEEAALQSPGGFRLYNISEVVSHMGKNKKMPITLGINLARGLVSLSPAKARDGPSQEWTADRLTNYSIEGKHVFLDLVRPSKSVDLHAGAKDTAQEIVSVLGELAGASKAEGLREVWAASSGTGAGGKRKGTILYDFMAQGDDEVTVAIGDEVVILDDSKSEEWWMVKRLKNGKEGVVPSSYVEITGNLPEPSSAYTGINAARSTVEQNRIEEERLTREMARSSTVREPEDGGRPERHSSLARDDHRKSRHGKSDKSDKPKPNAARVRTWTDRSGSFKVEAEFIGLKDGKIHLHKQNGVKIAVPVTKMAVEDLEYVERATGISLDEDKPLSEIKRRSTDKRKERPERLQKAAASHGTAGASMEQKPDYDWFDFFLGAGVNPQICERYAAAFSRDQMGEEVLPDVDAQLLRTLGLKEGDILRVMKYLDSKFGRTQQQKKGVSFAEDDAEAANGEGGLFSGPGGALRNNTRKGRPAPAVQTNDVVDPDAFKQKGEDSKVETPLASAPAKTAAASSGFDDDAWDVKPSKTAPAAETPAPAKAPSPPPAPAAPEPPKLTQNMSDLSLLSPPLQPTPAPQPAPQAAPALPQQPARTGADPSFFDKLAAPSPLQSQVTGMRQRPTAPSQMQTGNSLIAPPPRAASAPGLPQQGFAPPALQPQLTGYQAPNGQSLQSLQQQQQFQQQQQMGGFPQQPGFQGLMPQATGYMQSPQQTGFPAQYQMPQATGFGQQPFLNGQATGSPFADPPRAAFQPTPTGMNQSFAAPQMQPQPTGFGMPPAMQPQQTGLPPALQPQRTGFQPQSQFGQSYQQQQNGGYGQFGGQQAPPMPPMPPMPAQPTGLQPLVAQKTGPAPNIRFGVQPAAKLTPQPTGRANLAKATPQNPFGF